MTQCCVCGGGSEIALTVLGYSYPAMAWLLPTYHCVDGYPPVQSYLDVDDKPGMRIDTDFNDVDPDVYLAGVPWQSIVETTRIKISVR